MNSEKKTNQIFEHSSTQPVALEQGAFVFNVRNLVEPLTPRTKEAQQAIDWYMQELGKLPEITSELASVTDGQKWVRTLTSEGEIEKIEGAQFSIEGRKIKKGSLEWNQPILVQKGEWIETKTGEKRYVIAVVLMITDSKDRVLLTVDQEPAAPIMKLDDKEIRPVVKTPAQTSMTKMKAILEGDRDKDKNFSAILDIVKGEKTVQEFIAGLELISAPTDGNRMDSNVLYGSLNIDSETADKIQAAIPDGKFLTKDQIKVLTDFGALNGVALTGLALKDAKGSIPANGKSN